MYVAMTRARNKLVLMWAVQDWQRGASMQVIQPGAGASRVNPHAVHVQALNTA